ncbi:unnamed protein product [Amoebophrya sp. A120]|nr:unnamed protein product [Amoebophrya sp. A120]|eukprot:GSA120T00018953001.1
MTVLERSGPACAEEDMVSDCAVSLSTPPFSQLSNRSTTSSASSTSRRQDGKKHKPLALFPVRVRTFFTICVLASGADPTLSVSSTSTADADCLVDPNQAKCCQMSYEYGSTLDDGTPCIMACCQSDGTCPPCAGNQGEVCSVACEHRYKSLGHSCWQKLHMGVFWMVMKNLCDPQDNYFKNGYFDPPATGAPGGGVNPNQISGASSLLGSTKGAMMLASVIGTATWLFS